MKAGTECSLSPIGLFETTNVRPRPKSRTRLNLGLNLKTATTTKTASFCLGTGVETKATFLVGYCCFRSIYRSRLKYADDMTVQIGNWYSSRVSTKPLSVLICCQRATAAAETEMNSWAMSSDYINDDDAEDACLAKLDDILTQWPPGGRRRNEGPAEIVEHLYLGSMVDALDLGLLRRLRITHVLNCAPSAVRRYADSLRVADDDCPSSWTTRSSCDQRLAGKLSLECGKCFSFKPVSELSCEITQCYKHNCMPHPTTCNRVFTRSSKHRAASSTLCGN